MDELMSLSLLLSRQIETYSELLKLENIKTGVLFEGKTKMLDTLLKEEQPLIMESSNLEQERIALQQKMGNENLTLKQIIAEYDSENKYGLSGLYEELSQIIKQVKRAGNLNTKFISSRLRIMRNYTLRNDVNDNRITYTKNEFLTR